MSAEACGLFSREIFLQRDLGFFLHDLRWNRGCSDVCTVTVQYYEVFAAFRDLGSVDFLEVYFSLLRLFKNSINQDNPVCALLL